jgi:WD40 repeat protein
MVYAVAVTADGCRAVSGADDGTVRVWDRESAKRAWFWKATRAWSEPWR